MHYCSSSPWCFAIAWFECGAVQWQSDNGCPPAMQKHVPGSGMTSEQWVNEHCCELSVWNNGRSSQIRTVSLLQVIARLGNIQTVNATPVSAYERKDSELRYMRSVLGKQLGMNPFLQFSHQQGLIFCKLATAAFQRTRQESVVYGNLLPVHDDNVQLHNSQRCSRAPP